MKIEMTRHVVPTPAELKKLLDLGLTHQQIADRVYEKTGVKVRRTAITAAVARAGLSERTINRYRDTLPWRVKAVHTKHYAARMLRLLGRRLAGEELPESYARRLDSWLAQLREEGLVVGYWPESEDGFYYVDPREGVDGLDGIPIRIPDLDRAAC